MGPGAFQFSESRKKDKIPGTDATPADTSVSTIATIAVSDMSVTWNDDEKSFGYIRDQRKDPKEGQAGMGEIQFKAGIAELDMQMVRTILEFEIRTGRLSFNRAPLPNNPSHGNFVVKTEAAEMRAETRRVSDALQFCVSKVHQRVNDELICHDLTAPSEGESMLPPSPQS